VVVRNRDAISPHDGVRHGGSSQITGCLGRPESSSGAARNDLIALGPTPLAT